MSATIQEGRVRLALAEATLEGQRAERVVGNQTVATGRARGDGFS